MDKIIEKIPEILVTVFGLILTVVVPDYIEQKNKVEKYFFELEHFNDSSEIQLNIRENISTVTLQVNRNMHLRDSSILLILNQISDVGNSSNSLSSIRDKSSDFIYDSKKDFGRLSIDDTGLGTFEKTLIECGKKALSIESAKLSHYSVIESKNLKMTMDSIAACNDKLTKVYSEHIGSLESCMEMEKIRERNDIMFKKALAAKGLEGKQAIRRLNLDTMAILVLILGALYLLKTIFFKRRRVIPGNSSTSQP